MEKTENTKTELEKILSVSGKSGIFKLITGGKATIVVESLVDGKRMPVHPTQKVSSLSDISMFTHEDDIPLKEVLVKMKEVYAGGPAIEHKSEGKLLRAEMKKVLPDYDEARVYESDIRKLFMWYNILQAKDMLEFADVVEEEEEKEKE
jgi:Domain of unknown function (DUF5606)